MLQQPRDRTSIKPLAIVDNAHPKLWPDLRDQGERVVRPLPGSKIAVAHDIVHREVFEDHDALEQRLPARHVAPTLDLDERSVLIFEQLALLHLELFQPW